MNKKGPIIFIDDDRDDAEMLEDTLKELMIHNPYLYFSNGIDALQYLQQTTEKPFLIFCDINMPVMNGIQLREKINEDEALRNKSIPFVFYTTSATPAAVKEAYKMSVQGFFIKEHSVEGMKKLIECIINYWQCCWHPND
jgi:CheY-like chemotaxis protein